MNRLLLTFLFISYLIPSKGQNQANIWYFGSNAGIDFNGSTLTPLLNSSMFSVEGTSVASGPNGSVLFYTNGQTVWNRNHQVMTFGNWLSGSSEATQSCIIIPKPGSKSKYYIFTVEDLGSPGSFKYSEVDMTGSGGLGTVTSKNNFLESFVTEKLTAVRHRNGKDYWVLVHERNSNRFIAYPVTENGPQSPVNSYIGSSHASPTGYMKFSPNGEKVACAVGQGGNFVEVFNFNDSSGLLSSQMKVEYPSIPYGVEFSPNSKRLYVSSLNKIYQYTLPPINNSTALTLSEGSIVCDGSAWALQTGPDGKIYVCKQGNKLGVINNPNNDAAFIDFKDNHVSLGGRLALQGLPNFIQNLFNHEFIVAENGCVNQYLRFSLRLNGLDSVRWNFGDGRPGSIVTSFTPAYNYSHSGNYTVSATVYNSGYSQTFTKTVTVYGLPQFSLGGDTTLCKGSSVNYNINLPGAAYLWNTGNRTGKQVIVSKGLYFLEVIQNGCVFRDSVTIGYDNLRASFEVNNPAQCITANKFEFTSTSAGSASHTWSVNGQDAGSANKITHSFAQHGTHKVSLVAVSAIGCSDSISKEVSVNNTPKAAFDIKVENNCGASNKILITDRTNYPGRYEFEFESDGYKIKSSPYTFHYSKPGTYSISLSVKTEDGCRDMVTKTITVHPLPEAAFSID
ncbi:MAG TPA: PKD domain-containing protein, partial [Bacteroidia bacterium]|nr:PKD domain-containing protein [Bacteroidia bacterium]